MRNLQQYLEREIAARNLRTQSDVAAFIAGERAAFWHRLASSEPDDAKRRQALSAFDKVSYQLQSPAQPAAAAPRPVAPAPMEQRSRAKPGFLSRDLLMAVIGAAIAVPGTLLANYLSNLWFPQTTNVSVRSVGVQQLNAPQKEFVFMQSTAAKTKHDGTIEVVYGMGVDPSRYKCTVTVDDPARFAKVVFEAGCRQVKFAFIDPSLFFKNGEALNIGWNNTAVFTIEITSDDGQVWKGSQGIEFAVAKGV